MNNQHDEEGIFSSRILSGISPRDPLHLGHYFGVIKQYIELQHEYPGETFYLIANYHALNTIHNKNLLQKHSRSIAVDYLALGIDPTKVILYRQSDVPQILELLWILSCVTRKYLSNWIPPLQQALEHDDSSSIGLLLSPGLKATDILTLRATIVPTTIDHEKHIKIARKIAESFNNIFCNNVLPLPITKVNTAPLVPGVDGRKMSNTYHNIIPIFAEEAFLIEKVLHMEPHLTPFNSLSRSNSATILTLYKLIIASEKPENMLDTSLLHLIDFQQLKIEIVKKLKELFEPFKMKRQELEKDCNTVEDILRDGARRAQEEANETLEIVRDCVGLGRYQRSTFSPLFTQH